jgi:hypothetical protein
VLAMSLAAVGIARSDRPDQMPHGFETRSRLRPKLVRIQQPLTREKGAKRLTHNLRSLASKALGRGIERNAKFGFHTHDYLPSHDRLSLCNATQCSIVPSHIEFKSCILEETQSQVSGRCRADPWCRREPIP